MPMLIMALLALAVFGLLGFLLAIAMIMEHSMLARAAKTDVSYPATSGPGPSLIPNFDRPRGEDTPAENPSTKKEEVHEHACTG